MSPDSAATAIQSTFRGHRSRSTQQQKIDQAMKLLAEVANEETPQVAKSDPVWPSAKDEGISIATKSPYAEVDRDRLCCDMLNTSVISALVGGFALGNMVLTGDSTLEYLIYTMACLAVHACTCSALTSALLYRELVRFREEAVPGWAAQPTNKFLLQLPLAKFGMGCISYLVSVVLLSFKDLAVGTTEATTFQYTCLIIGIMSMGTVFMTVSCIFMPQILPQKHQRLSRVAPH